MSANADDSNVVLPDALMKKGMKRICRRQTIARTVLPDALMKKGMKHLAPGYEALCSCCPMP